MLPGEKSRSKHRKLISEIRAVEGEEGCRYTGIGQTHSTGVLISP